MFRVVIVLTVFTALALADPEAAPGGVYGSSGGYSSPPQCYSKPHRQCHQKPVQNQRQECHTEYDIKVDTTYIEECEELVTTQCHETSKQVYHSSAVVGHDTQVVKGHGYHKRDADAEPGYGGQSYSSGPQCQDHVEHKCHKVPQQSEQKIPRQVCKTIVDTTYIEECVEEVITECHQSHKQVHHSSNVVGHDSQVIKGHGYH